ncbi:MAG: hypothetical protein RLZZ214_4180 [Verrucomicrobiota bacterium]|jgi:hypothetical protein
MSFKLYSWQRHQAEPDRCVPFIPDAVNEGQEFAEWPIREKADSLLVHKFPVESWLAKSGFRVPEDFGLAYPYRTKGKMKTWPGIDGNRSAAGVAAFDLVVEGHQANRLGSPIDPTEVLIKGKRSPKS